MNEYYEIPASEIHLADSNDVVGDRNDVTWSLDETKFICKTKVGITSSSDLSAYTPLTREQAASKVASSEYSNII